MSSIGCKPRRTRTQIFASLATAALLASPAASQDSAEKAMNTLTAQWYNAVVTGLQLDPSQFQLMQGNTSLGTTSDSVWRIFDSMPPESVNHFFNPAQVNSFAQAYSAVINNLIPQTGDEMQKLLLDKYVSWEAYQKDSKNLPNPLPTTASGGLDYVQIRVDQFQRWGLTAGLETAKITAGTTLLKQVDVVSTAISALTSANGTYAYTATIEDVTNALQGNLPSRNASLNSKTTSSDTSHAWASAEAGGIFDIFGGGGESKWQHFTQDIVASGLEIEAKFDKVATINGGPFGLSAPANPNLIDFKPWYDSAALNAAFKDPSNRIWKPTASTWQDTFGPNGNMKRNTTALVMVDGVTITMTSGATVETADRQSVEASFEAGFFPFFEVSGEGGWSSDVEFHDAGGITVTASSPQGNPLVIGALVSQLENELKAVEFLAAGANVVAACVGQPNNVLGQCTFNDGTQSNRMNCSACCAQRKALTWAIPAGGVVC